MREQKETILLDMEDGIFKITFNRPDKMNAFSRQMIAEVGVALERAENDDEVRVVVIAAVGRAFCAGADLDAVREYFEGPLINSKEFDRFSQSLTKLGTSVESLSKPVIAAVNGYTLAGGLEFLNACDLVICSEAAKFGDQHTNVGLIGANGATQRLPRLIGIRKAKELLLTGDMISAQEAERLGLVNKVVPADQLDQTVKDLAMKLASKSPAVSKAVKALVNEGMQVNLRTALELERLAVIRHHSTEDMKEGINAFLQKRKHVFNGK